MHNISRHGRVRPLLRTRVVLKVICSVDEGNAVVVAAGGGEEDLRQRKTVWKADPCCGESFVVGAAELGWNTAPQEQDKPHKVFFDTYL